MQKKNGNWYVVLELAEPGQPRDQKWLSPFKELGIPRPKSKREEKRIAEQFLVDKLRELQTGTYFEPSSATVEEYLETWIKTYCEPNLRQNSIDAYKSLINTHINPNVGRISLNSLRPGHIQQLLAEESKVLSSSTLSLMHTIIKQALKHAVKWEYVVRNVCDGVIAPRVEQQKPEAWSWQEAKTFLNHIKDSRYYMMCLLALTTGMRRGEILGLKWEHVDFKRNEITIIRQRVITSEGVDYEKPKTKSSNRIIDISPAVSRQLEKHRKQQQEEFLKNGRPETDQGLVFTNAKCQPYRPTSVTIAFSKLVEKAGVKKITFHGMRHTHATKLIEDGVNIKAVSERLGHSNISITLNTYAHVMPRIAREAATKTDDLIL